MPKSFFVQRLGWFARSNLDRVGCDRMAVYRKWPHWVQGLGILLQPKMVMGKAVLDEVRKWTEANAGVGYGEVDTKKK